MDRGCLRLLSGLYLLTWALPAEGGLPAEWALPAEGGLPAEWAHTC